MAIKDYLDHVRVPLVSCAAGIEIVEPAAPYVFKVPQSDRMAVAEDRQLSEVEEDHPGGLPFRQHRVRQGRAARAAEPVCPRSASGWSWPRSMVRRIPPWKGSSRRSAAAIRRPSSAGGRLPGPAIVAKNMKTLGMKMPLICSHGVANGTFLSTAGSRGGGRGAAGGPLIVVDQMPSSHPQAKVLRDYTMSYQKTYRKPADTFGGHAYDAVTLLAKCWRRRVRIARRFAPRSSAQRLCRHRRHLQFHAGRPQRFG